MITLTLVAVLGILLAMTLRQLFRKDPAKVEPPRPALDLANLKITDARIGDLVSVSGAGDDFSDLDFKIDRHNQYEAGAKRWVELGGMYRERRVYLEVVDEDELEVSVVLHPNRLTVEDLGLNEQDLADMDERQNTADNFEFDGKVWFYRFSKEIVVVRDGQARGTGYYMWEFREDGGKRLLNVRKGEGEPFTASLATLVNAGDITVYREK
jgi:hypothetical protein